MTADAAGGVGVFADELARALVARGHQVLTAVFSPTRPAFTPGLHRLWAPFRLEWMDRNGEAGEVAAEAQNGRAFLAALARQWRPELLHSNHFAYAGAVGQVPTLLSVHSDVVSWWRHVRGCAPPDNAYQRWYAGLARDALASAGAVVTPSQSARQDMRTSFSTPRKVRVIANGRDAAGFACESKQALALTVGRLWDAGKQVGVLARISEETGMELAMAGELRHPLRAEATAAPRGVRVLGPMGETELRQWMARARVYIGTSLYEPFGLAPLEAALSGCALVLNDIGPWRELWEGAACFYRTVEELVEWLRRAAAEPEWAAERGQAARRHARQRYSQARMVQAYESAYRSLL